MYFENVDTELLQLKKKLRDKSTNNFSCISMYYGKVGDFQDVYVSVTHLDMQELGHY
jgi:hypothetical protein